MTELRARKPAGVAPWPLALVEGPDPIANFRTALGVSVSEYVARTFVADLGGGMADVFDALGDYEVLEFDGTRTALVEQLHAVSELPPGKDDDGDLLPHALIIDSASDLWSMVNDWTDEVARSSDAARRILESDPDASIERPPDMWNQRDARWTEVQQILRKFNGVAIVTALGGMVERNGQWLYRVDAHQSLTKVADAWLHVDGEVCVVRAAKAPVIGDPDLSDDPNPVEHLVFDVLGARGFAPLRVEPGHVGLLRSTAKRRVVAELQRVSTLVDDALKAEANRRWKAAGLARFDKLDEVPPDVLAELLAKITIDFDIDEQPF